MCLFGALLNFKPCHVPLKHSHTNMKADQHSLNGRHEWVKIVDALEITRCCFMKSLRVYHSRATFKIFLNCIECHMHNGIPRCYRFMFYLESKFLQSRIIL